LDSATFAELGSLAEFINGASFKPEDWGDFGAPIIRIQNLTDARKPFNRTLRSVPEKIKVKPGDLLVSWSATLGVFEWQGSEEGVLNQHIFRVVPKEHKVEKRYLRHGLVLALLDMQRHLHGATMQHVNRAEFLGTKLFFPSLTEQRRIVDLLDRAESLRSKRRTALDQLDILAQSIFLDLFGDTVSNPKGWPLVPLSSIIYFQEGPGIRNWQFRDDGVKLVNVGNIVEGRLILENTNRYLDPIEVERRYKHFLLDAGDFVVASSGVTWGKIAEVEQRHLPLCLNTSMIRFRPLAQGVEKQFIRAFVESPAFRRQILRLITGSAQPNFGPAHLKQVKIPFPPLGLQREFARRLAAVEKLKSAYRTSLVELNTLFATLQHRAFRGEL
jgi:type I restriction enzyme S subunit